MNEDTIGTIEVDGVEYDVDWPYLLDDPDKREDFAVIYRDGEQVGEFVNPNWEPFTAVDQVLELAREFIEMGGPRMTALLPTRDEIADAIYDVFTTQYGDVTAFDNAADAVLALLEGRDG